MREIRTSLHASDDEFIGTVEEITGRKVRTFVSGIDTGHDVSSEVFYFEPTPAASWLRLSSSGIRTGVSKGGLQFPGRGGTGFSGPAGTGTGAALSGTENRLLP